MEIIQGIMVAAADQLCPGNRLEGGVLTQNQWRDNLRWNMSPHSTISGSLVVKFPENFTAAHCADFCSFFLPTKSPSPKPLSKDRNQDRS